MLAFDPAQLPVFVTEVAGIERLGQQVGDFLLAYPTAVGLWKCWVVFEKAPDLGLAIEAACGIAFKRFRDDRSHGLVAHQDFAMHTIPGELVADRRSEHPIAAAHARVHLLCCLPPVLFALQSALRSQDGLEELAFRAVVEFVVEAFDAGAAGAELLAELEVELGVAGKAFEVVEDNDVALLRLRIEIAQERHHAGAFHEVATTGHIVGKNSLDTVAAGLSILTAAGLLRVQAVPFGGLFGAGYPAIDDGGLSPARDVLG